MVCGKKDNCNYGEYCSYQCELIASSTKKKFYNKKDLR